MSNYSGTVFLPQWGDIVYCVIYDLKMHLALMVELLLGVHFWSMHRIKGMKILRICGLGPACSDVYSIVFGSYERVCFDGLQ